MLCFPPVSVKGWPKQLQKHRTLQHAHQQGHYATTMLLLVERLVRASLDLCIVQIMVHLLLPASW